MTDPWLMVPLVLLRYQHRPKWNRVRIKQSYWKTFGAPSEARCVAQWTKQRGAIPKSMGPMNPMDFLWEFIMKWEESRRNKQGLLEPKEPWLLKKVILYTDFALGPTGPTWAPNTQEVAWGRNQIWAAHMTVSGSLHRAVHSTCQMTAEVFKYLQHTKMGIKSWKNIRCLNQDVNPGLPHHSQQSEPVSCPVCFTVKGLEVHKNLCLKKKKKWEKLSGEVPLFGEGIAPGSPT